MQKGLNMEYTYKPELCRTLKDTKGQIRAKLKDFLSS